MAHFFKGKLSVGFLMGFIDFLTGLFKKTGCFFVWANHTKIEDSYGCLIDILS